MEEGALRGEEPPLEGGLAEQRDAQRLGLPYLLYRDDQDRRHVFALPDTWSRVTIGRSADADLILSWDGEVSGIHVVLERLGDEWVLIDEGMSRNGSFVNGERVGRRRLADEDVLRLGRTTLAFRAPMQIHQRTLPASDIPDDLRTSSAPKETPAAPEDRGD